MQSGTERGSGTEDMKQMNIGNMKHVGGQGYERRISRNAKAGSNGLN